MVIDNTNIWFTAVASFSPTTDDGSAWTNYIEWSKLKHLKELVGLDGSLNEAVFEPDFEDAATYQVGVTIDMFFTYCYKDLDYVLERTKDLKHFNLLAVCLNPAQETGSFRIEGFEFIGYELLDKDHSTSALSNCGGFDETFLSTELNKFGLIDNHSDAVRIQSLLRSNNPMEHHADTNVWAIWRHITIGR